MRYTIPANDNDRRKEVRRILHATASVKELQSVQKALKWMVGCANGITPYDRKSYHKLYDTYKMLGITEGKKEATLFPPAERNADHFKRELDKLWRVLEVHAQEKNPTLLTSYQNYQNNTAAYDAAFRSFDQEELAKRMQEALGEPEGELMEEAPKKAGRTEAQTPLVDASSPYANLVEGSVYSELYDLYQGLKPKLRTEKNLPDRLIDEDMQNLLSAMQFHYLRRNSMGSVLPMTEDEHQELQDLYQNCLRDCNKLSEKLRETPEYKTLHTLLTQNEDQLKHLSKDNLPPLADAIRGLKNPSLHLISQENETIGSAISSREAVEYTDAEGNIKQGFFTAEKKLGDVNTALDQIVEKYEIQYPQYSAYFDKINSTRGQTEFWEMLRKTLDYHLFNEKGPNAQEPVREYFQGKKWIKDADKDQAAFWDEVMIPLITEIGKTANMHGVLEDSGIGSKSLVAERSTAMNDVASFLGYPDLLVSSKRVTVKRGDREETGVMMEPADMELVDPSKLTNDHPFYDLSTSQFSSRQMLSSLADLQILDYLCANTDRHAHNFFYRVDFSDPENPNLLGVQGIDNDNSFGAIKGGGQLKLTKSTELKIITQKMAEAVSAMTKEQLQEVLSPYHFSDSELKAAGDRLKELQSMIEKGRKDPEIKFEAGDRTMPVMVNKKGSIHIMQDEDWQGIGLQMLLPKSMDDKNIFVHVNIMRGRAAKNEGVKNFNNQIKARLRNAETPEQRKKIQDEWKDLFPKIPIDEVGNIIKPDKQTFDTSISYKKQAEEVDYQKVADMQKKELASLEKMMKQFDDARGAKANRSDKFKAMREALQDLTEEYRRMRRLDPKEHLIDEEKKIRLEQNRDKNLANCYHRIEQKREHLKQAIDTYLGIRHWRINPTANNQKRINTAKQLSAFILDTPKSAQFYKSSRALRDTQKNRATTKDSLAQNRYLTNEIHSMMKNTLHGNVKALALEDPMRKTGILALKAHERLWNYSQSEISNASVTVKKTSGTKERVPLTELLRQQNQKKAAALPSKEQICKDLKMIKKYAPELGDSIDRLTEDQNKLTPGNVKGVLGNLFLRESNIAKERNQAQKNKVQVLGE